MHNQTIAHLLLLQTIGQRLYEQNKTKVKGRDSIKQNSTKLTVTAVPTVLFAKNRETSPNSKIDLTDDFDIPLGRC